MTLHETQKQTFNLLKEKGLFQTFSSYEDWLEKKGEPVKETKYQDTLFAPDKERFEGIFGNQTYEQEN